MNFFGGILFIVLQYSSQGVRIIFAHSLAISQCDIRPCLSLIIASFISLLSLYKIGAESCFDATSSGWDRTHFLYAISANLARDLWILTTTLTAYLQLTLIIYVYGSCKTRQKHDYFPHILWCSSKELNLITRITSADIIQINVSRA